MRINGIDLIHSVQVLEYRALALEKVCELLIAQINVIAEKNPPLKMDQTLIEMILESARIETNERFGAEVVKFRPKSATSLRLVVSNEKSEYNDEGPEPA